MFSGLLDEGGSSSATASDGSTDRVVNGRNDEEYSVAAICNKHEDEPADVILDKTSSGSVEVDDNTSACDDEGKELCPLNNPGILDNEFILSADAEENEEITDTNSSHCSSPKKTDGMRCVLPILRRSLAVLGLVLPSQTDRSHGRNLHISRVGIYSSVQ